MSKYLVVYTIPARSGKRVVDALSPEDAAKIVRDERKRITDVVVEDLESEDENADHEVYEWCEECELPIWIDDEPHTYVMLDEENDTWAHAQCMVKRKLR